MIGYNSHTYQSKIIIIKQLFHQLFITFLFLQSDSNPFIINIQTMEAELTGEQYEQVLKYMEATSEENFETATLIIKQHNFNLNTAINARFSDHDNNRPHAPRRDNHQRNEVENDDEVVRKYIQFLQRENQGENIFSSVFKFAKNFTIGLFKLISEIFLPQFALRKILRSKFYVLYKDGVKVNVQDDKLKSLLENTKQKSHKCCFLVISPDSKSECIVELLNKNDVVRKIQENFYFVGFVEGDSQIEVIQNQRPPQVVVCRYNAYKQLKLIKRFVGEGEIRGISVQQLNRLTQQSRNLCRRDKNVLIKYRNFIRRQFYGPVHAQEQEDEEVNFIARQQVSTHIRQQNQEYLRVEEEELKRLEQKRREEEELRKQMQMIEEREEERKVRKFSIPDEPMTGNLIRFSFRCPDGSNISRNFLADQKVEILYHWVQTNEQIDLEDNRKREFQILYSFPPTSLQDMKHKLLNEVFESDQEKLLIKEL